VIFLSPPSLPIFIISEVYREPETSSRTFLLAGICRASPLFGPPTAYQRHLLLRVLFSLNSRTSSQIFCPRFFPYCSPGGVFLGLLAAQGTQNLRSSFTGRPLQPSARPRKPASRFEVT